MASVALEGRAVVEQQLAPVTLNGRAVVEPENRIGYNERNGLCGTGINTGYAQQKGRCVEPEFTWVALNGMDVVQQHISSVTMSGRAFAEPE